MANHGSKKLYLQTYKDSWRIRRKVPLDVRSIIGKREFLPVLGRIADMDECEARRLAGIENANIDETIRRARAGEIPNPNDKGPSYFGKPDTFGMRIVKGIAPIALMTTTVPLTDAVSFDSILASFKIIKNPKPHDYRDKDRELKAFAKWLGHDDATRVTAKNGADYIQAMLVEVRNGKGTEKTVQNRFSHLKRIFDFAEESIKLTTDPFAKVTYRTKQTRIMIGYTPEEHQHIVTMANAEPDHIRYAVLFASWSGARLGEYVDATTADVVQEVDDIWCLKIRVESRGENQTVKTDSSIRTVPLHSELIRQGFLDYMQRLPATVTLADGQTQAGPLFPAFKLDRDNRRAGTASEILSDFIYRKCEIEKRKDRKPTHAWRNTVATQLAELDVRADIAFGITGHSMGEKFKPFVGMKYIAYVRSAKAAVERLPNYLA